MIFCWWACFKKLASCSVFGWVIGTVVPECQSAYGEQGMDGILLTVKVYAGEIMLVRPF